MNSVITDWPRWYWGNLTLAWIQRKIEEFLCYICVPENQFWFINKTWWKKGVIVSIAGIGVIKFREQGIIDLVFNCDGRKIIAVWLIRLFDRVNTGEDSWWDNNLVYKGIQQLWGSSSVGRAPRSQRGGREFESPLLHHLLSLKTPVYPPYMRSKGCSLSVI